ncbi:unnamed protein product [Psylliodes chrysocephalus]|uniref:Major facilitator superfamily (MFS) profile domain-containing protein n=1 Tax=Psylliodes chrysocephalus TaxID=3402493 RepID=A0A9P0D1W1_9CUCU|nr:unnamed protein product [Psylliodes chrysocephala]
MTFLPQMMKSALHFDLTKSGLITALPWIAMTFSIQVAGHVTDWILKKGYMSLTSVRKLTISIGFISQATFLFSAAMWISPGTTPIFIVLGATFGGVALSGIVVNPLDIAPKYASVIYGINNTFGTIPGIISPIITGYIVNDLTSVDQWKIIFYISSGIYLFGAITSIVFITGVKQPWAETFASGRNDTELTLINGKKEDEKETLNPTK